MDGDNTYTAWCPPRVRKRVTESLEFQRQQIKEANTPDEFNGDVLKLPSTHSCLKM